MHAAIWDETEVNWRHQVAALYRIASTLFDVVALLCCAVLVLGTWRFVSCSLWSWGCLSMSVFIPHWKRSSSLFSAPSAKRNRKCSNSLLKLSSYSDLDYQSMVRCFAHYLVSAVFDLAAVCYFLLLLTIWHLRIRVSLMFDNINNVGPESTFVDKLITFKLQNQDDKVFVHES